MHKCILRYVLISAFTHVTKTSIKIYNTFIIPKSSLTLDLDLNTRSVSKVHSLFHNTVLLLFKNCISNLQ